MLFIDLDPEQVDINVHPAKQEIKFEDEKIVYAFVQSAVKHALAQFSITLTLDFELDASIQQLDSISKPMSEEKESRHSSLLLYQGFTQNTRRISLKGKASCATGKTSMNLLPATHPLSHNPSHTRRKRSFNNQYQHEGIISIAPCLYRTAQCGRLLADPSATGS